MAHYQTEEQQLEVIRDFFKQNSGFFVMFLILILLSVLGYRYWQSHHTKVLSEASTVYESLMQAASKGEDKNIQAFADRLVQSYPQTIYAQAGELILAKFFVQNSQMDKAKQALTEVMNNASLPPIKQIARIRLARVLMNEQDYTQALSVLKVRSDKHYDSVVFELEGDIYLTQQQLAKAKEAYEQAMQIGKEKGMVNGVLDIKLARLAQK